MLTHERLKHLLDYSPETGEFTWKVNHSKWKSGDVVNTKHISGYIVLYFGGNHYLCHRLAWFFAHGRMPSGVIDHINHVRSDNRLCNLREASPSINSRNRSMGNNNKTGVLGVYFKPRSRRWWAEIQVDGKKIHLGYFDTKELATEARKQAERRYNFHPLHGDKHRPPSAALITTEAA